MQLLEKTIVLSFISYDLYKLYKPSLQNLFKNINNIEKKFKNLIKRLKKMNLYLLGLQNPEELERMSPELIELGKHLIIKRIASQKVYMEKLSFMVDLISKGDTSQIRKFQVLKYMRYCIEVSILSLNIYNKSVFVTKMEESSLKLKSIVINKPMLCEVEFPFVVVFDSKSLNIIFCVTQPPKEIKKLYELGKGVSSKENSFKKKEKKEKLTAHELLKPKDKSVSQETAPSRNLQKPPEIKKATSRVDEEKKNKLQILKRLTMQKEKMFFEMNNMLSLIHI